MTASVEPSPSTALSEADIEWLVMGSELFAVPDKEALGLVSWLWQESPLHADWSVGLMRRLVEPAFEHRQFALARHKNGSPLLYTSWALLDERREQKLLSSTTSLSSADWIGGEHIWMIDWIAPRGGTSLFHKALGSQLFAGKVAWALRVRPDRSCGLIQQFRGQGVSTALCGEQWRRLHRNLSTFARLRPREES